VFIFNGRAQAPHAEYTKRAQKCAAVLSLAHQIYVPSIVVSPKRFLPNPASKLALIHRKIQVFLLRQIWRSATLPVAAGDAILVPRSSAKKGFLYQHFSQISESILTLQTLLRLFHACSFFDGAMLPGDVTIDKREKRE